MNHDQRAFILDQNTTIDELITYIRETYPVRSKYLSKNQFCYISYRETDTGAWLTVKQEKSTKLAINCINNADSLLVSRRSIGIALIALGFKVKNYLD
jgi:predicted transglutaminase-like protease